LRDFSFFATMLLNRIFSIVFLTASLLSLFLPYTHRFNIRAGIDYEPIKYGWLSLTAYLALFLMAGSVAFLQFGKTKTTAITSSVIVCFNCWFMLVVRSENHFQGILSSGHEYDTKSGFGFYVLCCCAIGLFILSMIFMIRTINNPRQNDPNEDLLDDIK
jgi:hypothetical protein